MMHIRTFLKGLALFPLLPRFVASVFADTASAFRRVRPGEPGWPDPAATIAPLEALAAQPASFVNETEYFQTDWQTAFWGNNYARLIKVTGRYDPDDLVFVHHGVGREAWSADGFTISGAGNGV
jgi:hypothetical protein